MDVFKLLILTQVVWETHVRAHVRAHVKAALVSKASPVLIMAELPAHFSL